MNLVVVAVCAGVLGLSATVIGLMMRHRERGRKIGREAEGLNVTSDDTRRSFWSSSADVSSSDGDSGGGDGGGGGGD
jgi:hypothetical protein